MTILLTWLFAGRGFDDPYITYRYAANLAQGHGFVYNQGERVLSTTTPLYTFMLAGFRLLGADLPLASSLISSVSLGLGGWAFWHLGQAWNHPVVGATGLILLPTFPLLNVTIGAETAFYIILILLGLLAYSRKHNVGAAILLALATLTRADGILVALVLAVDLLIWRRRPIPWGAALAFLLILFPWFAFAFLYFGEPFPVTLAAKQRQAALAQTRTFLEGFVPVVWTYLGGSLASLHYGLAIIGLGSLVARPSRFLLLLGWSILYFIAYSALGVASYFWYYAPLVPGFVVVVGLGVDGARRIASRMGGQRVGRGVAVGLVCLLLIPQMWSLWGLHSTPDSRTAVYREVGQWLNANTEGAATVGAVEVGIIGYYAQRRMIDFAGLIQPQIMARLEPGTTYEDAALWAIQRFQPDYLVLHEGIFPRLEADAAVRSACRTVKIVDDAAYPFRLVVYACDA